MNAGRRGFTIMEVIVTILIMAGIMVTITQILNAVRNSRDRIHNMQEATLAGPDLLDRIESDLRAITGFDRDPATYFRVKNRVIQGLDADSIDFVASTNSLVIQRQRRANDRFVRADANEVGYRLRPNPALDDFLELWRREDFGIDDEPLEGGNYSFLHERIKRFNVEVFEEDGPDAEPLENWGTESDEHQGFPARIEIELVVELAPRLVRETLVPIRREMTFRRTFRFPQALRRAQELQPVVYVPDVPSPTPKAGAPSGPGDAGDGSGSDGPSDGSGGGNLPPFGDGGGGGGPLKIGG